jgi:hypothetical protein
MKERLERLEANAELEKAGINTRNMNLKDISIKDIKVKEEDLTGEE